MELDCRGCDCVFGGFCGEHAVDGEDFGGEVSRVSGLSGAGGEVCAEVVWEEVGREGDGGDGGDEEAVMWEVVAELFGWSSMLRP